MPEGHSVHRIARQFNQNFLATPVSVSSPQGRFSNGAAALDRHSIVQAVAVGKQLFLEFDHGLWLRVHLGIYGAWDFSGEISLADTLAAASGRIGQTQQRGTELQAHEDSPWSMGAPRRTRLRMAETEKLGIEVEAWPPPPIGQVRVRLMTEKACADLRGPTACVLCTAEEVDQVLARLGPDPLVDEPQAGEERFTRVVLTKPTPIAVLLMDQSVVAGIGNVYRAELLFRARLDPFCPGRDVPEGMVRSLWRDWAYLLNVGVQTGQMLTMDNLTPDAYRRALAKRSERHWVYHRAGEPCRVCATNIALTEIAGRKLYWCPVDQQ